MFERQIAFIDSLDNILNDEIRKTIDSFGYVIKDYITERQLYKEGVDGNGKKLRGYKRITIRLKINKGQPADRTTLKDGGSFYASIQVNAFSDSFEVSTNVSYDKYLLDPAESYNAYGFDAIKPSTAHLKEFMDAYIIPNIRKRVQEAIK